MKFIKNNLKWFYLFAFAPIIFLYVESDIVECNFFFCKFQTLKNDSLDIVQVCTLNGDPTNCTELHKNWIGEIP